LGGVGMAYFTGNNTLLMLAQNVNLYGGLGLFTVYMAYDTHQAI